MKKRISAIWTIVLVVFFFYLLYQSTFAWNVQETASTMATSKLPQNKTAFLMITDTHFGVRQSGISAVQKSLQMWDFDSAHEMVYLKHQDLLPTDKTQMMVLYDKGYTSFEHNMDVLSLINFPYSYIDNGNVLFQVYGVNENGEVFLNYKNQRIHLKVGEAYHSATTEGYMVTWTTIKNYGIYDKSQFNVQGQKATTKNGKPVPDNLNLNQLKKQPLEPTKPQYDTKPLVTPTGGI